MKRWFLYILIILALFPACNTMYSVRTIDLEIVIPGGAYFPDQYEKLAIRYNNANAAYNPVTAKYFIGKNEKTDAQNLDSVASYVYYDAFVKQLTNQVLFDSIVEIRKGEYKNINWIKHPDFNKYNDNDSIPVEEFAGLLSNSILKVFLESQDTTGYNKIENKHLHPQLGLYTKEELQEIRKSTNADALLSLDLFESVDSKIYNSTNQPYQEVVQILGLWNFFDLRTAKLKFFYDKIDTIFWSNSPNVSGFTGKIPPRKHAVLNAAEISGSQLAEFLFPHWVQVERMYYKSGQADMRKAEKLMKKNRWFEAAEIWKKQTQSKNKFVASKSMFNLAVANEMQGNFDAAIDWTVKSYHNLGNKYLPHPDNCLNYINLLALRKQDLVRINYQIYGKDKKKGSE